MNAKLHTKVYADIKALETKLSKKYKYDLMLSYRIKDKKGLSHTLDDMYSGLIDVIKQHNPELQHYFIKNKKTRKKEVLNYMHAFRYIALDDYKFGVTEIAKYLGLNHSTVIHSRKLSYDLIYSRDPGFMRAFTLLTEHYNSKYKYVGISTDNIEK